MAIKKDNDTKQARRIFPVFSPAELQVFDRELEPYWFDKALSTGETVRLVDFDRFLEDKRALRGGAVVMGQGEPLYALLWEKIEQWRRWRGRIEYGRRRGDQDLESMALALKNDFEVEPYVED